MAFLKKQNDTSSDEFKLFYEDFGSGQPVILIHGWPLSHEMWEYKVNALVENGYRVITYDRRGFGQSSKPWDGYNYDVFAEDLKMVIDELGLADVVLVGFSMGGGEVARYFGNYEGDKVSKVVFIGSVTPFMLKTDDNPEGIDSGVFDQLIEGIKADRPDFLTSFGKQFYGVNLVHHPVSQPMLDWNLNLAMKATSKATTDCVRAFSETDFREDLRKINVPTLIIHGNSDQTVPIELSGDKTSEAIANANYIIYQGAPHGLFLTERDKLNKDLLSFLKSGKAFSEI